MLMVTDLIDLARSGGDPEGLAARSPARFQPSPSRAPVVVWNVCRHCNQSCPHCYASAGAKPSLSDLSTAEALALIDDMADTGVRFLILSGGEPLLRQDLVDLAAHASARGVTPHLSTNGVLIDEPMAKRLSAAGVGYVGVSLDGLADFNDPYRVCEDGYERAVRGIGHARTHGMRTGVRITVSRRNRDQLAPLLLEAERFGADRFYVSHLLYAGRGRALVGDDLSRDEGRELLVQLFERADELLSRDSHVRVVTGGNDSDGPMLMMWIEERYGATAAERVREVLVRRGGNSAGEGVICIDNTGKVHPDQFWRAAVLGDVREQPLAEILRHPLAVALRDRTSRLTGRCGQCSHVDLCRGSHRERALASYGDMWAEDPSCVLTDTEVGTVPLVAGGLS